MLFAFVAACGPVTQTNSPNIKQPSCIIGCRGEIAVGSINARP